MDRPREPFDEKQMISRVLREAQGNLKLVDGVVYRTGMLRLELRGRRYF